MSKFHPIKGKEYILSDQCFWETLSEEEQAEYNPYDKTRKPHAVSLMDAETGTLVNLVSGSRIIIVEAKGHEHGIAKES